MISSRGPRKLLTRAAVCASTVVAATLVVGCAKEMVGEPACSVECGTSGGPLDGGPEATDASDAADAVGSADAGVVATPIDGGDGGDGG